jgi:hypothetical protein
MDAHPAIAPLLPFAGVWRGEGRGEYPSIEPFGYGEELRITATPKPFLVVTHRTWALDDGRPLHVESGYWRVTGAGLEAVLAHPFGATEVLLGEIVGTGAVTWRSETVTTTPTAKRIDATSRELVVDGDTLTYRMAMAAVGEPMTHHLAATLRRAADAAAPAAGDAHAG